MNTCRLSIAVLRDVQRQLYRLISQSKKRQRWQYWHPETTLNKGGLPMPHNNSKITSTLHTLWAQSLTHFPYNYFALIMATGIISLGCQAAGFHSLAFGLLILNSSQYVICVFLALSKFIASPAVVWRDLIHSDKGPGFLTMVAGTCMLGEQYDTLTELTPLPFILLSAGIVLYLLLIFSMIAGVAMSEDKCSFNQGLDGLWLLCTVAGCSIVVLGAGTEGAATRPQAIFCTALWAISIMLYMMIIPMIFFRWLFTSVNKRDFSPSWWINMGALAISSLAGTKLLAVHNAGAFATITPIITAMIFFLWAMALWWLLLLLTIFFWRLTSRVLDYRYVPGDWSIVFPSGMIVVASFNVLHVIGITPPNWLIKGSVVCVFLLWFIFYIRMLTSLGKSCHQSCKRKAITDSPR
jgi:tellurite resistance protein TehA-like permease